MFLWELIYQAREREMHYNTFSVLLYIYVLPCSVFHTDFEIVCGTLLWLKQGKGNKLWDKCFIHKA